VDQLKRLLRYTDPYRGRLGLAVLAMALYAIGNVGIVYLVQRVFDKLLIEHPRDVAKIALLLLGSYFLKGVGAYFSGYLMTDVGQRVVMDIRNRLFGHILNQSAAFFSRRTSGQLISRITNDVANVQRGVSETLADLVQESFAVVFLVGRLFYLDAKLALFCMTAVPLIIYPLVRLGQRVRRTTRRSQEELEHVTHLAGEAFSGHRIVKAFGAEARETERFSAAARKLYLTNMKVTAAVSALPPLMEFIGGIAAAGALWYGSKRISEHQLSVGEFASFLAAAFMMYGPIKSLSRVNAGIQQTISAAERIFGMLDTHSEVKEKPGAASLARLTRDVEFRNVGFAYDDQPDKFVLRNVSLSAKAGQVVAIVGLSGAGKTTLVNLIPRFYDVTEGAILIDGVDIRDVTLRSLRQEIALVTQETVLFDDTIAANISYGAPGASQADIEAAAKAAHAHEFITTLAGGYQARIGERGQRLSGGQRQRLAIARALLKNCPLLVLDEATSSLDAESEQLVQDALVNLMRNRTTFVIAHRLSTVRRADLLVAIEGGRVVEMGTHDELVGKPGGVYAKLYALQAFDDRDDRPAGDNNGEGIS
jgi:subfamily B ATP-binding cassette protein MsbA